MFVNLEAFIIGIGADHMVSELFCAAFETAIVLRSPCGLSKQYFRYPYTLVQEHNTHCVSCCIITMNGQCGAYFFQNYNAETGEMVTGRGRNNISEPYTKTTFEICIIVSIIQALVVSAI